MLSKMLFCTCVLRNHQCKACIHFKALKSARGRCLSESVPPSQSVGRLTEEDGGRLVRLRTAQNSSCFDNWKSHNKKLCVITQVDASFASKLGGLDLKFNRDSLCYVIVFVCEEEETVEVYVTKSTSISTSALNQE